MRNEGVWCWDLNRFFVIISFISPVPLKRILDGSGVLSLFSPG